MPQSTLILDAAAMQRALTRIAHEIAERNENGAEVALVGIQRGGVFLARRLAAILPTSGIIPCPSANWTWACTATTWTSSPPQHAAHRHPL